MKIALVTDSTSYLTKAEIEKYNVQIVPIPVIIDEKEYQENVDLDTKKLFELQNNGSDFPKTSQPSIGQMLTLFENLNKEGFDQILVITLSSTISGYNQSLNSLATEYPELNIHVFDSEITVRLMGYMVIAAGKMIEAGYSIDEIIDRLEHLRTTQDEVFVVNDLNNLVRGGRLSNAGGLVGSMLQIKPLLTFDNESHKIVSFDKVRSMKKALIKAKKIMDKSINSADDPSSLRVIVYHSNDLEAANELKDELVEKYPKVNFEVDEFGPVVATHLGEKAIGLTWMTDVEKMQF